VHHYAKVSYNVKFSILSKVERDSSWIFLKNSEKALLEMTAVNTDLCTAMTEVNSLGEPGTYAMHKYSQNSYSS